MTDERNSTKDPDATVELPNSYAILYELLVGTLPFDSKELRSAGLEGFCRKIREEKPLRPSTRLSIQLTEKTL